MNYFNKFDKISSLISFTLVGAIVTTEFVMAIANPQEKPENHTAETSYIVTVPEYQSKRDLTRALLGKEPEVLENDYQIYKKDYLLQKMTMLSPKTMKEIYEIPVLSRSGLTEEQLRKGLKGELKQFAGDFLEIERKYGINAVFFASICATESAWGEKPIAKNNYMSWTTDTITYYEFDTAYDGFDYGAIRLKSAFLLHNGNCYNGDYIKDVNICYAINPDGSINWQWYQTVSSVAERILEEAYK